MLSRSRNRRILATVLFTDIVSSTTRAEALGDRAWRELLARHHRLVRQQLKRHRGREVDTAGDGFFATFEHPTEAIGCAIAIADAVSSLGLEIRAGIHTGEVEPAGKKVAGIAVHVGARILAAAEPGQIVVSSTVRELATGSGTTFREIGLRQLKGVEGEWRLFAVERPRPAEAAEESPRTASRRLTRPAVVGGTLILLGIGLGAAVIVLTRGPGVDAATGPNTIRSITADGRLASGYRVGQGPSAILAVSGQVWVANTEDGTVSRVNIENGEAAVLGAGVPTALASAGGMVWALDPFGGTLSAINPAEARVVDTTRVHGRALAAAGEVLWIADDLQDVVYRIDGRSRELVATISLQPGSGPSAIAADTEDVWVVNGLAGTLAHLSASSGDVIASAIALPGIPSAVAVGQGVAWVASTADDLVMEVDAGSNRVLRTFNTCDRPSEVQVADATAWVTCLGDGTVRRLSTDDGAETVIQLDGVPGGVSVDGDRAWVTIRRS